MKNKLKLLLFLGVCIFMNFSFGDAYMIQFDYNSDEVESGPGSIGGTAGVEVELPSDEPIINSNIYEFLGWSLDQYATDATYQPGSIYYQDDDADVLLYAVWRIKEYIVTYYVNGGSGGPSQQPVQADIGFITIGHNIPTRTDYVFMGWGTSASGGDVYWLDDRCEVPNDITLFAQWEEGNYAIKFDANGGIGGPKVQAKKTGIGILIEGTEPTRESYTFLGWSSNSADTEPEYEQGDVFELDGETTLYAVWQANSYFVGVIIDAGGECGSVVCSNSYPSHGTEVIITATANEGYGYVFSGWEISGFTYGGDVTLEELRFIMPANDVEITANFELKRYTISYDANGGIGGPNSETKIHGQDLILQCQPYAPTKLGHSFLGWDTDPGATTVRFSKGSEFYLNEDTILYAVWKDEYIVSYEGYEAENLPEAQTKITDIDLLLSSVVPKKNGCIFIGWSTDFSSNTPVYEAGGYYVINENVTLYACWYYITEIENVEVGSYVEYIPTKSETTVLKSDSGYTGDKTFYPSSSTKWRVIYNENGCIEIVPSESIGKLNLSGKVGYARLVYTLNKLCEDYINPIYAKAARNPGYTENSIKIINTDENPITFAAVKNKQLPYDDNYYDEDYQKLRASGIFSDMPSDTFWTSSRGVSLSIDSVEFYGKVILPNAVNPRMGILYTNYENGSESNSGGGTDAKNVYPIVTLKSFLNIAGGDGTIDNPYILSVPELTYDANGGENAPESQIKIEDAGFILTDVKPTRRGYNFLGWATDPDSKIAEYKAGETLELNQHITLYAVWKKRSSNNSKPVVPEEEKTYNIKAEANGGGSITPSGKVTVKEGDNKTFTITSDKEYEIKDVIVDGKKIGAVSKYTFSGIDENHSIEVIFDKKEAALKNGNVIFVMGKQNNFNEILFPLNILLKADKVEGELEVNQNKAILTISKDIVNFENGSTNIVYKNKSIVLTKPIKILNNKVYITLVDFLKLK